jgi:hypothetical protein
MEIRGNLLFSFKLKDPTPENIQRAMLLCEEMEGARIEVPMPRKRRRLSKEESYNEILEVIKSKFKEGFTMQDAIPLVFDRIGKRKDSIQNAVSWAIKQDVVVREGGTYVFREQLQEKALEELKRRQSSAVATPLEPIAPSAPI